MTRRVRIGTRGSQLALWQADETARQLANAGIESELVVVRTTGDRRTDVSLASIGGKGLFIKELEDALVRGEIDLAVHSLKDVPSLIPDQFALAAFLERADPRDAWVQPEGQALDQLPDGAVVGTSAPRRRAQLAARFPRLRIEDVRGNVDTRLAKARRGQYAGLVLASAGLTRLGRADEITAYFSVDEMLPAAGQGIVAIECLRANEDALDVARTINNEASEQAALCERGVLQAFGARLDCYSAIAVHARFDDDDALNIRAFCGSLDGTRAIRVQRAGRDAQSLINAVHDELVAQGAEELLWREKST
ncbi:MAG: hydroxymethylbilane synthase [Acidobacteria bacterium]|nr:hydroxymethylbilane synthase [Acidobacteriota bacterium]MBV9475753.1 hydroxymethylbilane synthase [Acidobacteriota bacterium]